MTISLLIVALIIFCCIVFNNISSKIGVPVLVAFIILGMLFGSDGIFKIDFDNFEIAETICSIALIFIMFYGGFGTKWKEAKPIANQAILLSTLGVLLTAGFVALFCHFVLKRDFLQSLLIGSVISSTDAASVFSVLRSKRLNLKYNTASLLEVESGSNDPCSYMLTIMTLSIMGGNASGGFILVMFLKQVIFGVVFGVIIAWLATYIMKRIEFESSGFDTIFVLAVALIAYAAPSALGGNGYLSAYIVGIILGNSHIKNKKVLVHFFDGITGLMQILIFFLLGLLAFPSNIPAVILPAALIALFLTFVARPIAVALILTLFKAKLNQQIVVSWAGLRGAASIVFAIMATTQLGAENMELYHIVFFIALFSILLQGGLLPLVSKKCNMVDDNADVLKTFNDYVEDLPVQFIQFKMPGDHEWVGKAVNEILLPPNTILALLCRGTEKIVPNGDTVFEEGDYIVLGAKEPKVLKGVNLTEVEIYEGSEWEGKQVYEISPNPDHLVIMIQRDEKIIIPTGTTEVIKNDILVVNKAE